MPTGEHLGKKLDKHGLFSGDTNALQSVKLSTAKEKAKELQLAGGLDLLSKVQSVICRAEMVPNPTLFGENSTLDTRTTKPPIMCTNLCDLSVGYGNPETPVRLAVGEIIQEITEQHNSKARKISEKETENTYRWRARRKQWFRHLTRGKSILDSSKQQGISGFIPSSKSLSGSRIQCVPNY